MTILGERKNNSATRLHLIFTRVPPQSPEVGRQVWARAFELPQVIETGNPHELIGLVRRLMLMAAEIERVRVYAITTNKPTRLWEPHLRVLESALMLGQLEGAWGQGRITPDAMLSLDMLSEEMPDEGEIEEVKGQVDEIISLVRDVIKTIMQSDLPAAVKLELLRVAEELKEALLNIGIVGPLFLQKTIVQVAAMLNEMQPVLNEFPSDKSAGLFRTIVARAAKLGPYVERLGRVADRTLRLIEGADRVRKLMSGDPTL